MGIAPGDFDSWAQAMRDQVSGLSLAMDSVRGGHALEQYRDERTAERVPLADL